MPNDDVAYVFDNLGIHFRLIRQPSLSSVIRYNLSKMAEYEGCLAAMDEMMLETAEKVHKVRNESTYSEKMEIPLPPLDPISWMLSSSVELTLCKKDEIMVLL